MIRRVLAIALATIPAAAEARDFLYPHKPGTTMQAVSADQEQCIAEGRALEAQVNAAGRSRGRGQPAPLPPGGGKAWLAPGIDGMSAMFNGMYDCLRDRGYVIRRMPSAEYRRAKAAGGMAVMQAMVAPASPHAEVPSGVIK